MKGSARYCSNCGDKVVEGDRFCANCGSNIGDAGPDTESKSSKIAYYVFMAVLFVLWLAMGMPTDRFWWR
jgi:predicted amidophosphoribosyltransferase